MFVENKKSICVLCLAAISATTGVGFLVSQEKLFLVITCMAFVVLIVLFTRWYRPFSAGAQRRSTGVSTYQLTKSISDIVIKKIEQFDDEIMRTQKKISATISDSTINIKSAAECGENETDNIIELINKTKIYNSDLFKYQNPEKIISDLDELSNHIIIAGQKGLVIIDRIRSGESAIARMVNEFHAKQFNLITDIDNKKLNDLAGEIRKVIGNPELLNDESFGKDINLIEEIKINIAQHASLVKQRQPLISDICFQLLSLSAAMSSIAVRLMKVSRMFEDNLTILLKMCELSILFQAKSQTFLSSAQEIKSRLNRVLARIQHDHERGVIDEMAALQELETINRLVNDLMFDCPI